MFEKSAGAVKALVDACKKIAPDLGKKIILSCHRPRKRAIQ